MLTLSSLCFPLTQLEFGNKKGEKVVRKEWVVKDKPTQKEILHVVDSIKVQEQVNSGLIPADRIKDSELHSLVVETNTATQNGQNNEKDADAEPVPKATASDSVPNEQEWYTVTRRRAQMQKSSIVVGNKGSEGGGSSPSNG
ncbi:hypothetical protein RIF29_19598 [Crotalaria pallida]|uniref:Uncharacterized protein n=1 Tax=Crotalaria pallida TaxID=3830 RepID=A0AAN9F076_CROPI